MVSDLLSATWTTVWTDRLTTLERYQARVYDLEPVPGRENQYLAYIACPLEPFEEGSVTSMMASITGNVFGFKAIRALRLEDLRIPVAYVNTLPVPAERDPGGARQAEQVRPPVARHPQGSRAGATANRVALEACVQARNEGRDLAAEGPEILKQAARQFAELAAALDTWREIRFDFEAVDTGCDVGHQ